jgi:hypothetical protein
MATVWKKGRGKLGPLAPILGSWKAASDSPMGPMSCSRVYAPFGDGYVKLEATWAFAGMKAPAAGDKRAAAQAKAMQAAAAKGYREVAFFGPNDKGQLTFWSYTSDGKKAEGVLADGSDVHKDAICFEAQMPAGLARQVFWPDEKAGFRWAVESRTKKGWNRFTEHHYKPV